MADLDVLVPEDTKVTTISGEEVIIPAMPWGREVKILRIIKELMGTLSDSGVFNIPFEVDENGDPKVSSEAMTDVMGKVTELLLDTATEKLTGAVALIVNKDIKWVEDNLDAERIVYILVPFFQDKRDSLSVALRKFLPTTPKVETEATP
jgi:hypothetical protein